MKEEHYYRFSRISAIWNGELIIAEPLDYGQVHLNIQREWWYKAKLQNPIPDFRFLIDENAPMLDNYWNVTFFDIYSSRLISIFKDNGVAHELFPVDLVGKISKKTIPFEYNIFRLLEFDDVIDEEKSVFYYRKHRDKELKELRQFVIKEDFIRKGILITRVIGYNSIVIIHDQLKQLMEKEGITGCLYTPLEIEFE